MTSHRTGARDRELLDQILLKLTIVKGPDRRGEYVAWCPFHPDGKGKPPHAPNLHVSVRGYYCHACQENGGLAKLAKHLGGDPRSAVADDELAYDYRDEDRAVEFQVVRLPGKKFRQRRPDGNGGWIWNLKGVRRVLYRLPELIADTTAPVYIVEGEKDADGVAGLGLVATTNPGGAGKWRAEYSEVLRGRDVVILPDNDDPGRQHAHDVARALDGIARTTKVVELPGLPPKGDVSDWLAASHTLGDLEAEVAATQPWTPAADPADTDEAADTAPARETLASALVKHVLAAGVDLFHDQRGDAFAAATLPDGRRILSVETRDFARWMSRLAWEQMGKAVGGETLSAARNVLAAKARFDGPERPLHVRCARHEGSFWIDMDGLHAIRVRPGTWDIVSDPPILFRSFPHQRRLPEPRHGGDPRRLLSFLNLSDPDGQLLLLCFLVAALVPEIPIPALVLHGVQGSAKTTLFKMVKRLLDPGVVEVRGGVRDPTEYAQAAAQSRVLFFDNLTSIPEWLSDALCRTVTGDGWSKRALYTDEDATVFECRAVVGAGGINLVADRPDLLDRSLIVALEPIPPTGRRDERELWDAFEEARPDILGGLLDALARAIEIEPGLKFTALPRMADFARWGAAAAEALGWSAAEFLSAYRANVGRQNEAAIETSPTAQATIALMDGRPEWRGEPAALLSELNLLAPALHIDTKDRRWPKTPGWLGRRLKEVQPNLLALGLEVTEHRTSDAREIRIRRVDRNAVIAVDGVTDVEHTPVPADGKAAALTIDVMDAVMPNPLPFNEDDGGDDSDGIPAVTAETESPDGR